MELQESKAGTHQTRDLAYNKDLSDESSPRKTVFFCTRKKQYQQSEPANETPRHLTSTINKTNSFD
jgi:hypothetical protein